MSDKKSHLCQPNYLIIKLPCSRLFLNLASPAVSVVMWDTVTLQHFPRHFVQSPSPTVPKNECTAESECTPFPEVSYYGAKVSSGWGRCVRH